MSTTNALSEHWKFFSLPPFFTQQPAPATLARQATLWGNLLLDHGAHYAPRTPAGSCPVVRFYRASSDVFYNATLHRRMPVAAARTMLETLVAEHPNRAVGLELNGGKDYGVLLATVEGGLEQLEHALLAWTLEVGGGTTLTMLAKKGVILTFDELAEGKCLTYVSHEDGSGGVARTTQPSLAYLPRSSHDPVVVDDVGVLTEEEAIRTLLQALNQRPTSVVRPFKITLFNMDGSTRQPYQGVKIGGE